MTVSTVTTGQDAHVNSGAASANFADARYPKVKSATHRILLSMPLSGIADKTIISATLSAPARGTLAAQTWTIQALSASWKADRVTWDNQPGVTGSTATMVTASPLSDGQRLSGDLTALVQAVADGQAHYGWRVTTDYATSEQTVYGFDSGEESWILEVEYSDAPDAPSQLVPTGVISLNKWVCSVDNIDDLAAIQVQVDTAADAGSPDFDSGEVATTVPSLDLATTAYAGLADAATTYWRTRVKNTDDAWSEWSDWAAVTRRTKPTFSLTSPSGATIKDSTPTIAGTLSAGTLYQWRLRINPEGNRARILYDTGQVAGTGTAAFSWTVPEGILREDADYELNVRGWDRTDRVASVGDDTFLEIWHDVLLDTDGSETAPNSLMVVDPDPDEPGMVLTWARAANPTEFVILRDGVRVGRVDGTLRTFTDYSCPPNTAVSYTVRAVTAGNQSPDSNTVDAFDDCLGVWLVSEDHGSVMLRGDIKATRRDKRVTFDLPGRRDRVDILTAFCGYEGSGELELADYDGTDVAAKITILDAIKYEPEVPVRLVWGDRNIPVYVSELSHVPAAGFMVGRHEIYDVSFEFWQSGEFDEDGMG